MDNSTIFTVYNNSDTLMPINWVYYCVHGVAWAGLLLSFICSLVAIILQQRSVSVSFYRRKLGERLVIYLAITDICFAVFHFGDHLLSFLGDGSPPDIPCILFAMALMESMLSQSMIVFLTATSLCLLVTCNHKIYFGPYDIGLLIISYGCPLVAVTACAFMKYLGPQGYWCLMNATRLGAEAVIMILGLFPVIIFLLNVILYVIVWLTIYKSARRLKHFSHQNVAVQAGNNSPATVVIPGQRYRKMYRTAKILSLFALAYLAQCWAPIAFYGVYPFFGKPADYWYIVMVAFYNCGGMYNLFAYTMVRKWSSTSNSHPTDSKNTSNGK